METGCRRLGAEHEGGETLGNFVEFTKLSNTTHNVSNLAKFCSFDMLLLILYLHVAH